MTADNKIFTNLKDGVLIENKDWNLKWGTPLIKLISLAETYSLESGELPWLNFGTVTIFNGIELNLVTPFDTMKSNNNDTSLNHLGQNLNLEDVEGLVSILTKKLGKPDSSNDSYGIFREWKRGIYYIRIIPRMAHGSDWSSIIIGKEFNSNNKEK